jgi:hypothetical protein
MPEAANVAETVAGVPLPATVKLVVAGLPFTVGATVIVQAASDAKVLPQVLLPVNAN